MADLFNEHVDLSSGKNPGASASTPHEVKSALSASFPGRAAQELGDLKGSRSEGALKLVAGKHEWHCVDFATKEKVVWQASGIGAKSPTADGHWYVRVMG